MEVDMEKWIIQLRISMTWTLDLPHIRLLSVSSASCVWYPPLLDESQVQIPVWWGVR